MGLSAPSGSKAARASPLTLASLGFAVDVVEIMGGRVDNRDEGFISRRAAPFRVGKSEGPGIKVSLHEWAFVVT